MSFLKSILPSEITSDNAVSPAMAKTLAWLLTIPMAAIVAPIIWAGVGGIIGLVLGLGVLFASIKFAPVFSRMVSNQVLKSIKWEARRNPIETYERQFKEQEDQINADEKLADQFSAKVERFRNDVEEIRKHSPEDYPAFQRQLQDREETLNLVREGIRAAKCEQVDFSKLIDRLKIVWRATQSDAAIGAFSERLSKRDAIKKIESDEALSAIKDRMATSRANLENLRQRMLDASAARSQQAQAAPQAALSNNPSPAVNLVQNKAGVYVEPK